MCGVQCSRNVAFLASRLLLLARMQIGAIVRSLLEHTDGGAIVTMPGGFGRVIERRELLTVRWFQSGRVYDVDESEVEFVSEQLLDSVEEYHVARNRGAR